jgi:hypothetical protein
MRPFMGDGVAGVTSWFVLRSRGQRFGATMGQEMPPMQFLREGLRIASARASG